MSVPQLPPLQAPRLLDQVRERVRYLHYSIRTEQAYVHWVRAFVRFHHMRHPREMGQPEVEAFLSWLAAERQVAVSTHRQALSALLFLYQKVFGQDLPWMQSIGRPHRPPRLPVVLSVAEVARVLALLQRRATACSAQLLYGTGMRIAEVLSLRVKDVDFENRTVLVRCGKGGKDRALMLPAALVPALREQLAHARALWLADVQAGRAGVFMPDALAAQVPASRRVVALVLGFPAGRACRSIRARGSQRRHHAHDQSLQRAFKRAVMQAGIAAPGHAAHAAPLLRHPSAAGRLRHTHGAGAAGPQRRQHHHDLHPRAQGRRRRGAQPARCAVDEIQKIPRWTDEVKRLWDEDTRARRDLRVVVLARRPC